MTARAKAGKLVVYAISKLLINLHIARRKAR